MLWKPTFSSAILCFAIVGGMLLTLLNASASLPPGNLPEQLAQAPVPPAGAPPLPGTPIGPDDGPPAKTAAPESPAPSPQPSYQPSAQLPPPALPSAERPTPTRQPGTAPPESPASNRGGDPAMVQAPVMVQAYVSGLQRALPSHGYRVGTQTGSLDPATESAILEYQRDAGMPEDAHSALSLKATLDSVSFGRPPIMAHRLRRTPYRAETGYSRPRTEAGQVRWVQERLNAKGYDVGAPDGRMGRRTADAIIAFEAENDMPRDPSISAALLDRLGS